jgi:hypothetical protein
MERLKYRATRNGKLVEIRGDQLFVENTAIFSLKSGLLQRDVLPHTDG